MAEPRLTPFDPGEWDTCIDRLYESVGKEVALAEALGHFRPFFDAKRVTYLFMPDGAKHQSWHVAACDVPPQSLVEYHSHHCHHDEWTKQAVAKGIVREGAVCRGSELVSPADLRKTYFYKDFLKKYNVVDALISIVEARPNREPAAVCSFHRVDGQDVYESGSVQLLEALTPHLRRALRLHRRLAPEVAVGTTLRELFATMDVAMLFIAHDGSVLEGNAAADALLTRLPTVLTVESGRLLYRDRWSFRPIGPALRRLASSGSPAIELYAFDEATASAASISLRRMHGAFTDCLAQHPAAAVCTVVPATMNRDELIRLQFGLTAAETQVAGLLARGLSVAQTAQELNVAVSTVRTHLAGLFAKTRTNRQGELVALLLSGDSTPKASG